MKKYDIIVMGAGTAGMSLVQTLTAAGWKAALIEGDYLGGTCINKGCIPSKTLIASAQVMQTVREAAEFGVRTQLPQANWESMLARKDQLVTRIRERSYRRVEESDRIDLYEGQGVFVDPHTVQVEGEAVTSERIVIATGARSAVPPVPGLSEVDYLTSTSAMEMKELPKSLFILGGGIIALEFSQLFARLGVEVTIFERGSRLASNLDPDISESVRKILEKEGVRVRTGANIRSILQDKDKICVIEEGPEASLRHTAEKILVATGRAPNSDRLSLERVGVETDKRGYITVDDSFATSAPGIWAAGDVTGGMMFTHRARHDAILLSRWFLHKKRAAPSQRLIPFAVFTDPEIASVGASEEEVVKSGRRPRVHQFPFAFHGRALAMGKTEGFIKLIVDEEDDRLLGAHLLGAEAGEIIHELVTAMRFGATLNDLQDMIHVHPTLSEVINSAAWYG